jgi:hypothetical protein
VPDERFTNAHIGTRLRDERFPDEAAVQLCISLAVAFLEERRPVRSPVGVMRCGEGVWNAWQVNPGTSQIDGPITPGRIRHARRAVRTRR